jgi:8-oxo-dGTP pyrophosphatase MutT (NUDIX family)
MSVRRGVVAIVFRKDKELEFLVLHRVLGWKGWEFPKGGIEKGDNMIEEHTVRRELKEETGLDKIRIMGKLNHQIKYKYPPEYADKYKHTESSQSVFLVKSFTEDVNLPTAAGVAEHDKFRWVSPDDARKLLTHDQQKKALDSAIKELKEIGL